MRELSYSVFVTDDAAVRQIEQRHFQHYLIAKRQLNRVQPRFALKMGQNPMSIGQLDPIHRVRQRFDYRAFNFDAICSGHVKISGSDSVTRTVCSK